MWTLVELAEGEGKRREGRQARKVKVRRVGGVIGGVGGREREVECDEKGGSVDVGCRFGEMDGVGVCGAEFSG